MAQAAPSDGRDPERRERGVETVECPMCHDRFEAPISDDRTYCGQYCHAESQRIERRPRQARTLVMELLDEGVGEVAALYGRAWAHLGSRDDWSEPAVAALVALETRNRRDDSLDWSLTARDARRILRRRDVRFDADPDAVVDDWREPVLRAVRAHADASDSFDVADVWAAKDLDSVLAIGRRLRVDRQRARVLLRYLGFDLPDGSNANPLADSDRLDALREQMGIDVDEDDDEANQIPNGTNGRIS